MEIFSISQSLIFIVFVNKRNSLMLLYYLAIKIAVFRGAKKKLHKKGMTKLD